MKGSLKDKLEIFDPASPINFDSLGGLEDLKEDIK